MTRSIVSGFLFLLIVLALAGCGSKAKIGAEADPPKNAVDARSDLPKPASASSSSGEVSAPNQTGKIEVIEAKENHIKERLEGYRNDKGGFVPHGKYTAWAKNSPYTTEKEDPYLLNEEGVYEHGKKQGKWLLYQRASTTFDKATKADLIVQDTPGYLGLVIKNSERNYRDGVLHGPFRSWDKDGDQQQVGEYAEGKKAGKWSMYAHGELKSEESLQDGKLNGPAVYFDYRRSKRSDHKEKEGAYKNGKQVGVWTTYAGRTGGKFQEIEYDENGVRRKITGYWDNGNKRLEAEFNEKGREHGIHKQWSSSGRLTMNEVYENGKRISSKK